MPVVQLVVAASEAELAADTLWQAGPSAVGEEALADGRIRLTADVDDVGSLPAAWTITVLDGDGEGYLDAWRAWAVPVRAGRHVVLQPAWSPVGPAQAADLVVQLDPGRTFGSGSHPSTRLVVAALETYLRRGDRLLDVGCGSGVLAVVGARLGATSVIAIDIDPQAPAVTEVNARANGVERVVQASTVALDDVEGRFEVVVANIGVRALGELADELMRHVGPGGVLVLAGLLEGQVDDVLARSYPGPVEVERSSLDGWSASVLRG